MDSGEMVPGLLARDSIASAFHDLMDRDERVRLQPQAEESVLVTTGARSLLTLVYVRCDEVIVEGRHRKKLHRIGSLSASLKCLGLLQPIAITPEKRLIVGMRRLTAAVMAEQEKIAAVVVDTMAGQYELLLAEVMENSEREQPAYSDMADLAEDLLPLAREAARRRRAHQEQDPELPLNLTEAGEALELVAESFKISRTQLYKIMQIAAAGRAEQAKYGDLVERMDNDHKVNGAYNELLRRRGRLKERPQEPDEFDGVSIHTNRKGRTNISISEDRTDRSAILTMFRDGMTALG